MNIASIDIGTNTVLLYIAQVDYDNQRLKTICNRYAIPRLGKGLARAGVISSEKKQELITVLKDYAVEIAQQNCEIVLAHSTYPLRTAQNSAQVILDVFRETGIKITVIDGKTEAKFSFLGATSGAANESPCVIDIGGGSTELSTGRNNEVTYRKSVPIGAVNLTEQFFLSFPPTKAMFRELNQYVATTLKENYNIESKISKGIAIAGTPTTLAAMKFGLQEFEEDKINGCVLAAFELKMFISELSLLTPKEILSKYGNVVKGREDVLLTGTLILSKILEFLNLDSVTVSSHGLRHGAVIDFLFKTSGKYFV
jgi:exopolyphosphatase / guanosine-5'-triphosphate,3'-diphosphate pyrophosphatase